jgi:glycosyltransferase involved in cell wall biosynthesis
MGVPSEPFILEQAEHFRRFEPLLISRDQPPAGWETSLDTVSIAEVAGVRGSTAYAAGIFSRPLTTILRDQKVDVLLAHFGVEGSYAVPSTKALGLPLATIFHGFDATVTRAALIKSRSPSWINYALRRPRLRSHGDLFLPVSTYLANRLVKSGFSPRRLAVHHTGINIEELGQVAGAEAAGRQFEVVHVARLVEKKGTEYLIRAIACARSRGRNVTLTCIGDGPLRTSLQRLAESLDCGGAVRFRGVLAHGETLAAIKSASALCLPSVTAKSGDAEGLGHVLLEASGLGKPVVATDNGGIGDAVLHGVTGLLVAERDAVSLAEALCKLVDEPRLARDLGFRGIAHVRGNFDIAGQTKMLEERLLGLVGA